MFFILEIYTQLALSQWQRGAMTQNLRGNNKKVNPQACRIVILHLAHHTWARLKFSEKRNCREQSYSQLIWTLNLTHNNFKNQT